MKFFLLTIIIILFCKNIYSEDLFKTSFYDVEFLSNNIENDKIKKINDIKKKSISNIFNKTLIIDNYNEVLDILSDDLINTFIRNIIINDEKIINNKYISKIKINFDKKKIVHFFREKKIPYVEFHPDKILLIIYEENKINDNIFTKNNNFYSYLSSNSINNYHFEIPNLDINDRYILNKQNIENINLDKINNFSKKYNLEDVIIISLISNKNKFIYDSLLFSKDKIIQKKFESQKYNYHIFFKILENQSLEMWKKLNLIQNENLNLINCKIDYYNMFELKKIRDNLNNITTIDKLNIKSLSHKSIEYDIYYYGNLKILIDLLNINQLNLDKLEKEDMCKIKLK
tara:strand:- start:234 stop:1265 length:1032 start_codon:yes stop_codon:yes gene_type:complete